MKFFYLGPNATGQGFRLIDRSADSDTIVITDKALADHGGDMEAAKIAAIKAAGLPQAAAESLSEPVHFNARGEWELTL